VKKDIKCEINIDPVVWVHFRCRVATQKYDTSCGTGILYPLSGTPEVPLKTSTRHSASGDDIVTQTYFRKGHLAGWSRKFSAAC
jgi:hypothetical protein